MPRAEVLRVLDLTSYPCRRGSSRRRSRALLGLAYDAATATLYVRYGKTAALVYVHPGVTSHQWAALRSADSLGAVLKTVTRRRPPTRALRVL